MSQSIRVDEDGPQGVYAVYVAPAKPWKLLHANSMLATHRESITLQKVHNIPARTVVVKYTELPSHTRAKLVRIPTVELCARDVVWEQHVIESETESG